jgi:hypothetical protein
LACLEVLVLADKNQLQVVFLLDLQVNLEELEVVHLELCLVKVQQVNLDRGHNLVVVL